MQYFRAEADVETFNALEIDVLRAPAMCIKFVERVEESIQSGSDEILRNKRVHKNTVICVALADRVSKVLERKIENDDIVDRLCSGVLDFDSNKDKICNKLVALKGIFSNKIEHSALLNALGVDVHKPSLLDTDGKVNDSVMDALLKSGVHTISVVPNPSKTCLEISASGECSDEEFFSKWQELHTQPEVSVSFTCVADAFSEDSTIIADNKLTTSNPPSQIIDVI